MRDTILCFVVRLFKKLRHCSKLINYSPCKMSVPPSQRDWSYSHPLAHPSQASVLLPVPPHQVQWNYTNYGGGVPREIPSPPPLPPFCLQDRYERVDEKRERDLTYEQKRKRKRRAMKRWLRKTWKTIDRKTRRERREERRKKEREGDWLKRRGSLAFSFHHWFRLPVAALAPLSLICQHLRQPKLSNNEFLVSRTQQWGWEGKRCKGFVRDRRCRWDEKSFRSNQKRPLLSAPSAYLLLLHVLISV